MKSKIGDISTSNHQSGSVEVDFLFAGKAHIYLEGYPHLFRKLNWWEHRKIEDMPKKLKSLCDKDHKNFDVEKEEVLHILEWDMRTLYGIINHEKMQVCSLNSGNSEYGYIPVD